MTTTINTMPELDWAKCGTASQARAHYRRGEKPCHACQEAARAYRREIRRKHRDRNR
jgi:hypothetical protein